jgi:glyoxylase-like metal-dependent hydrolase (beta-lactamase superfamily II)
METTSTQATRHPNPAAGPIIGQSSQPQIFAFICGRHTVPRAYMLRGHDGRITIAIVAFVITHGDRLFIFDTGFSRRVHEDVESYFPAEGLKTRRFHFSPDEELPTQMRRAGFNPDKADLIANSHLHYDHAGGNALFPRATVLVQRLELEAALSSPPERTGYRAEDFQTAQEMAVIDGEHDVFGDGSLVLFPTCGHSAGHQSLRVRRGHETAILAGDACPMCATLEGSVMPGESTIADMDQFAESLEAIRQLQGAGAKVFVSHDPAFWAERALGPTPLL